MVKSITALLCFLLGVPFLIVGIFQEKTVPARASWCTWFFVVLMAIGLIAIVWDAIAQSKD